MATPNLRHFLNPMRWKIPVLVLRSIYRRFVKIHTRHPSGCMTDVWFIAGNQRPVMSQYLRPNSLELRSGTPDTSQCISRHFDLHRQFARLKFPIRDNPSVKGIKPTLGRCKSAGRIRLGSNNKPLEAGPGGIGPDAEHGLIKAASNGTATKGHLDRPGGVVVHSSTFAFSCPIESSENELSQVVIIGLMGLSVCEKSR